MRRPQLPRRATGLAGWRLLLVLAIGLPLLLLAFAVWLVGSAAGTAWLLAQVPGLQVIAPQGALIGGAFEAVRVQWLGAPGRLVIEDLRWADLRWHWRPHAQAWVGIELVEARARRVEWRSADTPPSSAPLLPPSQLQLPLQARLLDLQIDRIEIDQLPLLQRLQLSAELGADGGSRHRVHQLALALDAARLRASGEIATDGELPLQWRIDADSPPGQQRAWRGWLELAGPLRQPQAQARVDVAEPAAFAEARATLAPFAAWPLLELQLESRDIDLAALVPTAPQTRLGGRADVRSSGLDAPIEADVVIRNGLPGRWDRRRLPLASLEATVRGQARDRNTVELTRFDARLDGGGVAAGRWRGSARWQGGELTLDTVLTELRPARLDARAPDLTLGGTLVLQAQGLPAPDAAAAATGAPLRVQAGAQITGRHGGLPGAPPVRLLADLQAARDGARWRAELRRFDAAAGEARANLTATADRNAAGAWAVTSRGRLDRFDPLPWWPGASDPALRRGPQRLNLRWDTALALAATPAAATTRGRAELVVTDSLYAGLPLNASARWSHAAGAADAQAQLEVELAGNQLAAQLRADGERIDTRGRVQAPRLAALRTLGALHPAFETWWPREGTVEGEFEAEGRWPQLRTRGALQLRGLAAGDLRLARLQASWLATLDPAARPDDPLQLTLDVEALERGVQRLDRLQARVDGSWAAHRLELDAGLPLRAPAWIEAWPAAPTAATPPPDGTALHLRGDGGWRAASAAAPGAASPLPTAGSWQGRIAELRLGARDRRGAAAGWLQARDLGLQVTLDADGRLRALRATPGRLQLLDAALRWSELEWSVAAGTATPQFTLDAELEPLAVAPWLVRLQPQFGWGGDLTLGATLQVRAAERFDADLVVERRGGDLELRDNGSRQTLGLDLLRLSLAAHDGTWHFTQAAASSKIGVLAGAQSLRTTPQTVWPDDQTAMEGVLELRVDNLGVWAPWLPPGWRLGGALRTSAAIGGRLGAPEYTGEMVGSGLAVRNLLQGVDVRDGELDITLRGADARVETFRFRAGEGLLDVVGGATFGDQPQAQLQLRADQFQLLGRVDRRLVVSGNADMSLRGDAIRVDGRFGVDRGLIDFTRSDAPSLDEDVTVVRRGEAPPESTSPPRQPRRSIEVRIAVDLGRQLKLRGRGLDTLLRGELALTTPGGRPSLAGTVRAEEGNYNAYGQKLKIDRGFVVFTGSADNPRLDILAVRPNLDVEVGVEIGGTAQNPRVRLYSDPAMSDTEILSWLILGREPDGLGRADTALLQGAAMALLSGEGEGASDRLLHTIGIDQLSFAPTQDGDTRDTVVTVGKQISRDLFVAYERGVNATSGSWQLIYRAARRLTVRAQTGEDTALDIIWTWRWD